MRGSFGGGPSLLNRSYGAPTAAAGANLTPTANDMTTHRNSMDAAARNQSQQPAVDAQLQYEEQKEEDSDIDSEEKQDHL